MPADDEPLDLSVVTVLYNSADVIDGLLASVPDGVELIVVDNASADDGADRAAAARPDAAIIRSPRNTGFGGGCNIGLRAATRRYVAFVNPDVRLRPDTLPLLIGELGGRPHAMIGPALLDGAGDPRPCKRRPSLRADAFGLLPAAARWAPAGWDGKLEPGSPVHLTGGRVAAVEGACFVIARDDLGAIGGFDEDFFLYYEEESIALRLARLGGEAFYEPRAVAAHAGASSTQQVATFATRQLHRSRVIFYRKRDGEARGIASGLMLIAAVLVSLPAAAINSLLRRPRQTVLSERFNVLAGLLAGITARLHGTVHYAEPSAGP